MLVVFVLLYLQARTPRRLLWLVGWALAVLRLAMEIAGVRTHGAWLAVSNASMVLAALMFLGSMSPLGFRRERLAAQRGRASDCPPGTVLSHRALLRLPDGHPLSLVTECYTRANLAR